MERKTGYNSTYPKKGGVSSYKGSFVVVVSLVLRKGICAEKLAHRKPKRQRQALSGTTTAREIQW
jgi:hypothetical protein